jgi:hypothetical protein
MEGHTLLEFKNFRRGLDPEAFYAIERFLGSEVGMLISLNTNYQICIRDQYINVYKNGCSLLRYEPLKRKPFSIHKKYLDSISGKNSYVGLTEKAGDLIGPEGESFRMLILDEKGTFFKAKTEEKGEKYWLAKYLSREAQKPFLIDLEIAFSNSHHNQPFKRDYVADRIDLAEVSMEGSTPVIHLVEVKIDTDPRIRSSRPGGQEVLLQMEKYQRFIDNQKKNLENSFSLIASNYCDLGLQGMFPDLDGISSSDVLLAIAKNVQIHSQPKLLVVRTGQKVMQGRGQVDHWDELEKHISEKYSAPLQWWPCHG